MVLNRPASKSVLQTDGGHVQYASCCCFFFVLFSVSFDNVSRMYLHPKKLFQIQPISAVCDKGDHLWVVVHSKQIGMYNIKFYSYLHAEKWI